MNSFGFAVVGVLLLVNALCLGAVEPRDIGPLLEKCALSRYEVTNREREAISHIDEMGPAVVPYLLPLLKHENETVRKIATWYLGDMNDLAEEHLDALIESRLQGNRSIAGAIARVGTPSAVDFLMKELKRDPTDTQVYWAFYVLGERGIPALVILIESEPLDEELAPAVVCIFGWLKGKAEFAVGPLTEFVSARRANRQAIQCAVLALGEIGAKAKGSIPTLQQLAQDDPQSYREVVDRSLLAMNAWETIADMLRRLAENGGSPLRGPGLWRRDESLVDSLMEFVSARGGNEKAISWAVHILGLMGPAGQRAVPVLLTLAEEDPVSYRYDVDDSLLNLGVPEAIPGVLRQLEEKPDRSGASRVSPYFKL
jgi:hypothetical protein